MNQQPQTEVIAFLSDGKNLPGGGPVDVVRTHGAMVFLSGGDAYKIKRDLRYAYLDFSTLQKRHDMLLRELRLNAPAAPSIYRDLIAVTRDASGRLQLGGPGQPVEWVLRMNRFEGGNELDKLAARDALDEDLVAALGQVVARYHHNATPRTDRSGADRIRAVLDQLNTAFADMTDVLEQDAVAQYRTQTGQEFAKVAPLLNQRAANGHVRRCHGDLHLGNIVLIDGAPTLFDALEFDETLGTCDVLYDLAFLLMDLRHKHQTGAANIVLNSYLFQAGCRDHYASLSLLPLFLSMRAAIRAMVAVQGARVDPQDATLLPKARGYLADGLAALDPAPARLVAIGGMSGTGKTVLARALAPMIGAAPGAVHLRSDLERKALFDVAPLTRLPQSAYDADVTARVYDVMLDKARAALSCGHSVVLDATWQSQTARAAVTALGGEIGARFDGIWLTADMAVLQHRVTARRNDASDADASVVRRQAEHSTTPPSWTQVDASGDRQDTILLVRNVVLGPAFAIGENS